MVLFGMTREERQKSKPSSAPPPRRTAGTPATSAGKPETGTLPAPLADLASRSTNCPKASRFPTTARNTTPARPPKSTGRYLLPARTWPTAVSHPKTVRFDATPNVAPTVIAYTVATPMLKATAGATPVNFASVPMSTYPK